MKTGLLLTHVWRFFIAFAVILLPTALPAQQWITVSPEEAASHLTKKVEPVYPAFAKAAGIQGTVRIHVGIGLDGRIGSIEEKTGPPSLHQAAVSAVLQYIWKPFENDGHPVAADTWISISFTLPGNPPGPPPPPAISWDSFSSYLRAGHCQPCLENVPPRFHRWLLADLKKQVVDREDGSESSPEFLSLEKALSDEQAPLPEGIEVMPVPVAKPGVHLYLFRPHLRFMCGASGNCPAELVEEDANGIRSVLSMGAGAFYIHPRADSPYPDIFTYWHMSASEGDVAGYSNVEGMWGQVYCGEMTWSEDQGKETDDVHVCR